jgi:hypothetical protein
MRVIGWTLIVGGVVLILWSFAYETSVHTDMKYVPGLGIQEANDILNLGLLQKQMMLLHSGIGAFLAGAIAACIGDLRVSMRRAGCPASLILRRSA